MISFHGHSVRPLYEVVFDALELHENRLARFGDEWLDERGRLITYHKCGENMSIVFIYSVDKEGQYSIRQNLHETTRESGVLI